MTQDEMRAKFEAWFSNTPLTIVGVLPQGDGYTKESIEWSFEAGYQAATAESERRIRELEEALKLALKRIHYLGVVNTDERHFIANEEYFEPVIQAVIDNEQALAAKGE